nr:serine/arginine repetitive matrix protein 1-like [Nerophis lumbriciformis]
MEDEPKVLEEEQSNFPSQQESSEEISETVVVKRARGRPKGSNPGSKKTLISTPDVNLMELVSGISNSSPTLGFENEDYTPKKRGRPKGTGTKRVSDNGTDKPKSGRGRPKGSGTKRKAENVTSEDESEGSFVKAPRIDGDNSPNGIAVPRGRGRPRKSSAERRPPPSADGSRRGRGRPKGSINKKPSVSLAIFQASRPRRKPVAPSRLVIRLPGKRSKRGRPRKVPQGRGRPRKYPLPEDSPKKTWKRVGRPRKNPVTGEALVRRGRGRPRKSDVVKRPYDGPPRKRGRPRKYPSGTRKDTTKPKVWKPLGRPRKYPLVEPPEGAPPPPRRTPGRPRKSQSKRGAHLRNPGSSPSPGRPKVTLNPDGTPRKRGRPKSIVRSEAQPDDAPYNHSDADATTPLEEREDGVEEQADDAPVYQRDEDGDMEQEAMVQE